MRITQSIRRRVDRATLEADRIMRANRMKAEIAALSRRIDDEERRMGARLVELFESGALQHAEFEPAARLVLEMRSQLGEKQNDLTSIIGDGHPAEPGQSSAATS